MEKYVVISSFTDKYTKEHFPLGSAYESDDTERVTFLKENGFLGDQIEPEEESKSDEKKKRKQYCVVIAVVKVDNLANEIVRQLKLYNSSIEDEIEHIKEEVAQETVKALKLNSPKLTKKYSKGWKLIRHGKNIVIHNSTNYQLTHLLENGHVNRDGSRTQGNDHIRPAEEQAVKTYLERVERAIQS